MPTEQDALVVFIASKPGECAECRAELEKGDFIRVENEKLLCLECADLDHLTFLPSGDVALTRRSKKHSTLSAPVLQWNRARKRYERRGLLAEAEAIGKAEEECAADDEKRQRNRERAAVYREAADKEYIAQFTAEILRQYPRCAPDAAQIIAGHACEKYSGRVGRSSRAKEFEPKTIDLAVRAHIRHIHTNYDQLLADGVPRADARARISATVDRVAENWKSKR
jgi:hypothetical protein